MKTVKVSLIIHVFALLHAVVALSCRLGGLEDELLLTILTMSMVLLICMSKDINIEFTAASIILANITGYLMGNVGANLLELFISSPLSVHALSTAVTTEVLGWSIVAATTVFRRNDSDSRKPHSATYMKWLLAAMGAIFVFRLGIVILLSHEPFASGDMAEASTKVFSNTMSLIILACINLLYVRHAGRRLKHRGYGAKALSIIVFMMAASLFEAVMASLGLPFDINPDFGDGFLMVLMVSVLAQLTVYCIVFMVNYAFTARSEMQVARDRANMAQYRYVKLKRQVNPHFLFNSLNILDCLVCEEKTEQASTYIHKLAGIYRYMIKSEDEDVVPLRDELVFVNLYVDLLRVRFPEGFDVRIDVPEEQMSRYVLPCSIQLLIENATKHNSISPDNPLIINVECIGNEVRVQNNIIPKVTKSPSTGLGQKYIRQQYLDLSGKEIDIESTDKTYCVTLPLL